MTTDYFAGAAATGYDDSHSRMFSAAAIDPAVDFLAELSGGKPALELGIGTGRIALPLNRRGVTIHGIDLSADMIEVLRAKPDSRAIETTVGDFASTTVAGTFGLAYLVFNTISNLTTQDEQVACFRNVADHLEPGGSFVIEVGVPQLRRLPPGETVHPFTVTPSHLGFDEYDTATQAMTSHHYVFKDGQTTLKSIPFRYTWPAELDLMARLAGMELTGRFGDWDSRPFTADSEKHVSVWRKPV